MAIHSKHNKPITLLRTVVSTTTDSQCFLPASDSDADEVQKTDVNVDDKGEQKGDESISKKEKSNRAFYRYYHGPKEEL